MRTHGKKYRKVAEGRDLNAVVAPKAALEQVKGAAFAKFDETVDVAIRLGVDPRHADQIVRGTVVLPAGTGKTVRVLVIAVGDKAKEAEAAGADFVGTDYIAKIKEGWMDFDVLIATPDQMGQIGALGRVLGPRGLMPNPKAGTITTDLARTIGELKSGRVEFKLDKAAIIHLGFAKASFSEEQIVGNLSALLEAVNRAKPSGLKGTYIKGVSISASMGPGVAVDVPALLAAAS